MAQIEFLLQALTSTTHAGELRKLLSLSDPSAVLISVAFAREAGIEAVEAAMKPLAAKTKLFVGIRNDITSIQAVKRLLSLKVRVYAVDTGSRTTIFHPKLYFAVNANGGKLIVGSANLTFGGLHNNIEASTAIDLDLSVVGEKKLCQDVIDAFEQMPTQHPEHVFLIKDLAHADALFESGRLADEDVIPAPTVGSTLKKGERDSLAPMKLKRVARSRLAGKIKIAPKKAGQAKPAAGKAPVPSSSAVRYLVWESKPLSRRDLTIPKSEGTNPTGSMGLKKGALDDIDHRHYFRDEVFAHLGWIADKAPSKWERAQASFELIIKNLNFGHFDLKLSHNTDVKSASYAQRNFMTQLHWGDARKLVARPDLLGRILYLYRNDADPPEFTIEID